VKFLVDAQLPPALARALREAGYEVQAAGELGLRDAEDDAIWDYALANQAVIVTKDQDFADRLLSSRTAPIIVWLRIGNTSNRVISSSKCVKSDRGCPRWIDARMMARLTAAPCGLCHTLESMATPSWVKA
jgi:predicted nuclease of predicted toxin-antitoxin system